MIAILKIWICKQLIINLSNKKGTIPIQLMRLTRMMQLQMLLRILIQRIKVHTAQAQNIHGINHKTFKTVVSLEIKIITCYQYKSQAVILQHRSYRNHQELSMLNLISLQIRELIQEVEQVIKVEINNRLIIFLFYRKV